MKSVLGWHCRDCLGCARLLKFYYMGGHLVSYIISYACLHIETQWHLRPRDCIHQTPGQSTFPVSFWVRVGPYNKLSSEMWAELTYGLRKLKTRVSSTLSSPVIATGASPESSSEPKKGCSVFIVSVPYCFVLERLLVGHWTPSWPA